jgi:excinuclease ABC subunit C
MPLEKYWKEISSMKDFKKVMMELAKHAFWRSAEDKRENWSGELSITIVNPKKSNIDVLNCFWWKCRLCEFFTNLTWFYYSLTYYGNKEETTDAELLELHHRTQRAFSIVIEKLLSRPGWFRGTSKSNSTTIRDKILDLSVRNAKFYRNRKLKQLQIVDPDRHTNRIMAQMKKDLRLSFEPRHIECFDNSNIQGTNPVAACVVLRTASQVRKIIVTLI